MSSPPRTLATADGDLAYEVHGPDAGPLALCLPGMGDVRSAYRFVAEDLAGQGWRVALLDLPGLATPDQRPATTPASPHKARKVTG